MYLKKDKTIHKQTYILCICCFSEVEYIKKNIVDIYNIATYK